MRDMWTPKQHEIAKRGVRCVLIRWVTDKRHHPDPHERGSTLDMTGVTTPEKAWRIWEILQEPEPPDPPAA